MKPKDITPADSIVPIYQILLSESEIQKLNQQNQEIEQLRLEREAKLESALNKLKSLGLTESEAKIIIGLE